MTDRLDTIYTADEAADRLRTTKRGLIKIARRIGACSRDGRTYLFSETDILAIWQEMREPATGRSKPASTEIVASSSGVAESLKWMSSKPPARIDKREVKILQWLSTQTTGKTHTQIERAGAKTIEALLRRGYVEECGMDKDGLVRVKITPTGREQLAIVEKWHRKREERSWFRGR